MRKPAASSMSGVAIVAAASVVILGLSAANSQPPEDVKGSDQLTKVKQLIGERKELDGSVWKPEVVAQKHEEPFVSLWDQLRATSDKFQVLSQFPFDNIVFGEATGTQTRELDIQVTQYGGTGRTVKHEDWPQLLQEFQQRGYRIVQTEWHHSRFQPGPPAYSTVSMVIHASNERTGKSYIVHGDLQVEWKDSDATTTRRARQIDARNVTVIERRGQPAFKVFRTPSQQGPLLVYDLNRDGLPDLILPKSGLIHRNIGNFQFRIDRLFAERISTEVTAAVLADVTGDGNADLICAGPQLLDLYDGEKQGAFTGRPQPIAPAASKELGRPAVISAGDIDGDGDLDLWIGQYKIPYVKGQMPTPYYDANDGFPTFLLRNDNAGDFTDITKEAGLAKKRFRRTYGGSFVDLDEDHDLDLVVVSDFAGIDIYENDGKGRFADVTESLGKHRHLFGMAATFADYNLDEKLDFFAIGMSSTTARRLDRLGLGRQSFPEHQKKRGLMSYGNRMFLGGSEGFQQASFNDDVARTGWSWGTTSFDFDNDGDTDIYIANGHISGKTAKDYCTHFWCHDIYSGSSQPDPAFDKLFQALKRQMKLSETSWNGFEHNVLFMNDAGRGFLNVGFLMGVALEWDSRSVVSADLNADGKLDLIVQAYSHDKAVKLVVLRNVLSNSNNWIGVRLHEGGVGVSPIGAKVFLFTTDNKRRIAHVVTGDSFASQHANTVHFGLGKATAVKRIEVHWPNDTVTRLVNPAVNTYHTAKAVAKQ